MTVAAGYRHEALFYSGADEFLRRTSAFIRGAVAADEPILVVLNAAKIAALRGELNGDADRVLFADMADVGANPARIIPTWADFVGGQPDPQRRIRGIGEPIWASRTPAELDECERHEALLNIAFAGSNFWLLCPYDTTGLEPAVLAEARHNHPYLEHEGVSSLSDTFPGAEALAVPFARPLLAAPTGSVHFEIRAGNLGEVRRRTLAAASEAGLSDTRAAELVLAVNEIATNSLRHGGGTGTLSMWSDGDAVICEVSDQGSLEDPLADRARPSVVAEGRRGLWLANQLCDLVQIRSKSPGTVVRLHMRRG